MITKNPMQLKAFIKNKAAENNISAQLVMQNYIDIEFIDICSCIEQIMCTINQQTEEQA